MQKVKSLNSNGVINILKCCLLAIVITLLGIVILAFVLKFVDLSSVVINYINDIIKGLAIFIMMICIKKRNPDKLVVKSIFAGAIYAVLCFVIFSILNGGFVLDMAFVYDLLFSIAVAVLVTIIINVLKRKV